MKMITGTIWFSVVYTYGFQGSVCSAEVLIIEVVVAVVCQRLLLHTAPNEPRFDCLAEEMCMLLHTNYFNAIGKFLEVLREKEQ